jgi:hypothetical protein
MQTVLLDDPDLYKLSIIESDGYHQWIIDFVDERGTFHSFRSDCLHPKKEQALLCGRDCLSSLSVSFKEINLIGFIVH